MEEPGVKITEPPEGEVDDELPDLFNTANAPPAAPAATIARITSSLPDPPFFGARRTCVEFRDHCIGGSATVSGRHVDLKSALRAIRFHSAGDGHATVIGHGGHVGGLSEMAACPVGRKCEHESRAPNGPAVLVLNPDCGILGGALVDAVHRTLALDNDDVKARRRGFAGRRRNVLCKTRRPRQKTAN